MSVQSLLNPSKNLQKQVVMMKNKEGAKEDEEEEETKRIWDCGSPLYDSYELVTFGHALDRHLMALPYLSGSCSSSQLSSHLSSSSSYSSSMASQPLNPKKKKKVSRKARGCSWMVLVTRFVKGEILKRKIERSVDAQVIEEKSTKAKNGICEKFCCKIGSWKRE